MTDFWDSGSSGAGFWGGGGSSFWGGSTATHERPFGPTTPPKPKPSGGGLLDSIEHFVEKTPGSNLASNFVHGAVQTAEKAPQGFWDLGAKYLQDTVNHPASLLGNIFVPGVGGALAADAMSHAEGGHGTHLENDIVVPMAKMYSAKYAPIFEHPLTGSSYKGVEKDPFGTFLDIATIATLPFTAGESAGLRLAVLGADAGRVVELDRIAALSSDAERSSELAKLGDVTPRQRMYVALKHDTMPVTRTVKTGDAADAPYAEYTLPRAKTPWGRALQNQMLKLRESGALRDAPVIGANTKAAKQAGAVVAEGGDATEHTLNQAGQAFAGLNREERDALHVVAEAPRNVPEGEWLATKLKSLNDLRDEAKAKGQTGAVKDLSNQIRALGGTNAKRFEKIHDVITNPSPRFERARDLAREAQRVSEENLGVDPEVAFERAHGPGRIQHGARWQEEQQVRVPGEDTHAEERTAAEQAVKDRAADVTGAQAREREARAAVENVAPGGNAAKLEAQARAIRDQMRHHPEEDYAAARHGPVGVRDVTERYREEFPDADRVHELHAPEPIPYSVDGREYETSDFAHFAHVVFKDGNAYITNLHIPEELRGNRALVKGIRDSIEHQLTHPSVKRIVPDPDGMTLAGKHIWDGIARRIRSGNLKGWKVVGENVEGKTKGEYTFGDRGDPSVGYSGQTFERTVGNQSRHAGLQAELDRVEAMIGRIHDARRAPLQATHDEALHDLNKATAAHRAAQEAHEAIPARGPDTFETREAGLHGGPTAEELAGHTSELHGDAFYFPHIGAKLTGGPTRPVVSRSGTIPVGEVRAAAASKLWKGVRQTMGAYTRSPEAWIRTGRASVKWKLAHDYQKMLMDNVAIKMGTHDELPEGYRWFQPTSTKAGRFQKERAGLTEELGPKAGMEHDADLEQMVKEMLPEGSTRPAGAVMAVPEKWAKAMESEFQRTNKVFHLMFERPMDLWRAAVLKYRPAWLVNNLVGQHLLFWISANPSSIIPYLKALKIEKGEAAQTGFIRRLLHIPSLRNTYGHMLQDAGHFNVGLGSSYGTLGKDERFMSQRRVRFNEEHPNLANGMAAPAKIVQSFGKGTTYLNQELADNWPRYARHMDEARRSAAATRVLASQEAMGDPISFMARHGLGKSSSEFDRKILEEMTPEEHRVLLAKVDRALGNFNTLTPFERKYMRRIFPFYAWFKVIGAVSKDLLIDSPFRVNIVHQLGVLQKNEPGLLPVGMMPSWLQGAIAVGKPKNGVQPLLSTTGLNPFATLESLGAAASSPFRTGGKVSDSTGLLGPAANVLDLYQGFDPFTGDKYKGPAANQSPIVRAFLGELATLPEVSLGQAYLHGKNIPGAPSIGAPGKPKTYQPQELDPLLNFLGLPIKHTRLKKAHQYAKEGL